MVHTVLRKLLHGFIALAILTALGQVRWNERSMEDRYHAFVNSKNFQTWFWAMAIPVTWTSEQLGKGMAGLRKKTDKAAKKASDKISEAVESSEAR